MTVPPSANFTIIASTLLMLAFQAHSSAQEERSDTTSRCTEQSSNEVNPSNGVFREFTGIVAGHALRSEPNSWTEVGTIDVGGFTAFALNVYGDLPGGATGPGVVSIVFVPDRPELTEVLRHGEVHLAIEAESKILPGSSYYFSGSFPRFAIGFPRYRVFAYNTTGRNTIVNVFAYLTR